MQRSEFPPHRSVWVPNREKRAWCTNIELEGLKGPRALSLSPSLSLLSFSLSKRVRPFRYRREYPFRIGAKNTAVVTDIFVQLRGYLGGTPRSIGRMSKRGDALKMQSADSRDRRCT